MPMPRSISAASPMLTGFTSTLSDGATACMAATGRCRPRLASRSTATRVTPGAISLSSSSHFPPRLIQSPETRRVAAWPRKARHQTGADRINYDRKYDRHGSGRLATPPAVSQRHEHDYIRRERNQFRRVSSDFGQHRPAQRVSIRDAAADVPAQQRQPLQERPDARLIFLIVGCRGRARRCVACARAAAPAPRAATPPPRRRLA